MISIFLIYIYNRYMINCVFQYFTLHLRFTTAMRNILRRGRKILNPRPTWRTTLIPWCFITWKAVWPPSSRPYVLSEHQPVCSFVTSVRLSVSLSVSFQICNFSLKPHSKFWPNLTRSILIVRQIILNCRNERPILI